MAERIEIDDEASQDDPDVQQRIVLDSLVRFLEESP
jgi:hypothetical protein